MLDICQTSLAVVIPRFWSIYVQTSLVVVIPERIVLSDFLMGASEAPPAAPPLAPWPRLHPAKNLTNMTNILWNHYNHRCLHDLLPLEGLGSNCSTVDSLYKVDPYIPWGGDSPCGTLLYGKPWEHILQPFSVQWITGDRSPAPHMATYGQYMCHM